MTSQSPATWLGLFELLLWFRPKSKLEVLRIFTRKCGSLLLFGALIVVQGHTHADTHLHKVTHTIYKTCKDWHQNSSENSQITHYLMHKQTGIPLSLSGFLTHWLTQTHTQTPGACWSALYYKSTQDFIRKARWQMRRLIDTKCFLPDGRPGWLREKPRLQQHKGQHIVNAHMIGRFDSWQINRCIWFV